MPDFGLTEALANALKSAKEANFVRAPEAVAAARKAGQTLDPAAAVTRESRLAPTPGAPGQPQPAAVGAPPVDPTAPAASQPQPPQPDLAAASTPAPDSAPPPVAAAPGPAPIDPTTPAPGVKAPKRTVPSALADEQAPGQTPAQAAGAPPGPGVAPPAVNPVVTDAQRFVSANISDFEGRLNQTHLPNVDHIQTPEGLKAAVLQVADDNKDAITAARRGTVGDEQLLGMAQDIVVSTDVLGTVLNRELGTQFERPEVVLAARMVGVNILGQTGEAATPIMNGTATAADILEYARQKETFVKYQTQLQGGMAEQGRGTRAMGISAPGTLPQEVVDHIADLYRRENPNLKAEADAVKLAQTPAGIANIILGSLSQRVGIAASSFIKRVFVNGILSGTGTWAKIFVGNNFNTFVKTPLDLFNAGMVRGAIGLAQRMGRMPTAAEGAQISDAFTYVHGLISGGNDAMRLAGRVLKTGVSLDNVMRFDPAEVGGVRNVNPQLGTTQSVIPELTGTWFGALAKGIDTFIDAPGARAIGAIDEMTKTLGARGYRTMMVMREISARLKDGTLKPGDEGVITRQMFENPSAEMLQAEEDWAHRQSFQSPFPEGGPGEWLSRGIQNQVPALGFIIPFMRTATNIFKQGMVETGPLAAFSARVRNQLAAGGVEADLARGRIVTGLQFAAAAGWMAMHDRLTGEGPKDPKERALWSTDGRQPNSVRVGDTWHSYAWFEPLAGILSLVGSSAEVYSRIHQDTEIDTLQDKAAMYSDMTAHVAAAAITHLANQSTMMGAAKFSEMFADPEKGFQGWATDFGTSLVPYSKAIEFARNVKDPYMREAWTLHDKLMNDVPGQSSDLGVGVDLFGKPRTHGGILGKMSPFPGSPVGADDVTDELHALMDHTHEVPFGMPSRKTSIPSGGSGKGILGGGGMPLTSQEYSEMVQKGRAEPNFDGNTLNLHDKLSQVMQSATYRASSPAERVAIVGLYANKADQFGRDRLYNENTDYRNRLEAYTTRQNAIKFQQ